MSAIKVELGNFPIGGPFTYDVFKNGQPVKQSATFATLSLAWDAIKADLITALGSETVTIIQISVQSN